MIAGVGLALITPSQNANGVKPAGDVKSLPLEDKGSSEATSVKTEAETRQNQLSRPVEPLSASNFRTLVEIQDDPTAEANVLQQAGSDSPFDNELTPEEEQEVQELKQIDAEVRAHEAAHKTAGGPVAGNVTFQTVTGPDGREYAVAGEVEIDASPVANNPEATIRKMELVIRAALAPAEPSPQDRAVAAQAQQTKLQAQQEAAQLREQEREERSENNDLGLQAQLENLQNEESGVNNSASGESETDSSFEIVSILFGSSSN